MLHMLTAKVQDSREALKAQAIGNALYGLKAMISDAPKVRSMLSALTPKVQDSTTRRRYKRQQQ
jgi:hypothetical protein